MNSGWLGRITFPVPVSGMAKERRQGKRCYYSCDIEVVGKLVGRYWERMLQMEEEIYETKGLAATLHSERSTEILRRRRRISKLQRTFELWTVRRLRS